MFGIMTPLTPAVVQKIEVLVPPESREAAGRMIAERCGADLPLSTHMGPDPSGFDRIRFAVLKLSHVDLERAAQKAGRLRPSPKTSTRAKIMTREELIFCLRGVHCYWSTPRISYYEIEYLEQLGLIQRTIRGVYSIRLTVEGVRVKNWGPLRAP